MLFSDIEGSTSLLSRLGDRYTEALDLHHSVLRSAWTRWGGTEMGTEGDGFFVVFEVARDAVAAALQAQLGLAAETWPEDEQVKVRIGVHTGEPIIHGQEYVGLDVHRAARLSAAAHGGQVVMTAATRQLVAEVLPEDAALVDLGWHRFKDFATPVRIYQLSHPQLSSALPKLKSLGAASDLPVAATTLVGRDDDLAKLEALIELPQVRLLTLTGTGGSGKTRLAIALAATQDGVAADGVFFVSLAGAFKGDDMWAVLAQSLAIEADSRERLVAQLAHRRSVVVLDNLEQIAGADSVVAELLSCAPELVLVATSRRPLHVVGEHEYAVSPLHLPDHDEVADVGSSAAAQLFCQHARMVRPGFTLTSENAADVAAICRRLDGLPLALELAAARTKLLSPAGVRSRLTSAVDLRGAAAGRPERQQALRDTIAWSYDLLPPEQRSIFCRLGVFAGGADLGAVAAVAMPDSRDDPFDVVVDLADASLITVTEDDLVQPRVNLLQTVADFAVEQLAHAGALDQARTRHAHHYLEIAESVGFDMYTARQTPVFLRMQTEIDNFRAALTWTLRPDDAVLPPPEMAGIGIRLCAALTQFWQFDRSVTEIRGWYKRALVVTEGDDSRARATVLRELADLWFQPPNDPVRGQLLEESLELSRRIDDPGGACEALGDLAALCIDRGELVAAAARVAEAEEQARLAGDDHSKSWSLVMRSELEAELGNFSDSLARWEEVRALAQARGDETGVIHAEVKIAYVLATMGQAEAGLRRLRSVSSGLFRTRSQTLIVNLLAIYAVAFARVPDAERAVTMLGTHWAHWERTGGELDPEAEEAWMQETGLADARQALGREGFERAIARGRAFSTEEAVAYAASAVDHE
jgi:predicted ATPase/class 3 adenylate cyclase